MATIDDILAITDATGFAVALSDLVCPRAYSDGVESLTPPERVAFHIDELEREVNNGGFFQFFGNLSGASVPDTIAALEAVGATRMSAIVRDALALFPGGAPPADQTERGARLDGAPEHLRNGWSDLDNKFYTYPDDLGALLRRYVEAHRDQFRPA
jgi:hypothetical protein